MDIKGTVIYLAGHDLEERTLFKELADDMDSDIKLIYFESESSLIRALNSPENNADLIFLDMDILKVKGFNLLDGIRELESCKNIPIVMFSTTSYLEDINTAFEKKANLFVPKSIFIQDIPLSLKTILSINWKEKLKENDRALFVQNSVSSYIKVDS
jgi:CheY-like chemotaxis protein